MAMYDDNFGWYEDEDSYETEEFYHRIQATNVEKRCAHCGRVVNIQPQYDICNRCADMIEGIY